MSLLHPRVVQSPVKGLVRLLHLWVLLSRVSKCTFGHAPLQSFSRTNRLTTDTALCCLPVDVIAPRMTCHAMHDVKGKCGTKSFKWQGHVQLVNARPHNQMCSDEQAQVFAVL